MGTYPISRMAERLSAMREMGYVPVFRVRRMALALRISPSGTRARPGRGHAHLRARGMDAALWRAVPLFPQPTPHTRGASRACRPCPREGTPDPINGSHRDPAKRKRATSWEVGRLTYRALPITCFLTGNPQFHRRGVVSRSCSTALLTRDSVTSVMRLRTSSLPWIGWRSLRYSPVL